MLWLVVDLLLGLIALVGLALVLLGLWRKVKELGREVGRAGEAIGRATDALADLQAGSPVPRTLAAPTPEVRDA
ncbi:MAG: hypothetical protein QOE05_1957 [Actinomycetota bacterium]|nr:hypothetical protein [Actinomycetota bacterium]